MLSAGGSELDLIGLFLTNSTRVPIGSVNSFPSQLSVANYFGATSNEATAATKYFSGFTGATTLPGALLMAQYNSSAVSAYVRGGNISILTLTQLQALSGTLSVTIDGSVKSASINLAPSTSFSGAAGIIANGLGIQGVQGASVSGSIGGTTFTVASVISGTVAVGDVLVGGGITAGTYITGLVSGTGGSGTYTVNTSQIVGTEAITLYTPAVQYDSVSGAFIILSGTVGTGSTMSYGTGAMATSLLLTAITGAVLSQGAAAAVPATFMNNVISVTTNWATFMTVFDPDAAVGNPSQNVQKLAFAAWVSGTVSRYAYVCWDIDLAPTTTVPATASLGYLMSQAGYAGTFWLPASVDFTVAAFTCGYVASIDFEQVNGRSNAAFRTSAAGLTANVITQVAASNIEANNGNFYGAYATANQNFVFLYPGTITGPFVWFDSYVNQIWLNNQFQLALMTLLTSVGSVPYNAYGAALIATGVSGVIQAGLSFGAFRAGVTLSATQIAQVNLAATQAAPVVNIPGSSNRNISGTLQTVGWFLLVGQASPQVREARGSPPCIFWYTDGQSVQQINLSSVELQ